jgi:hypothetical protein
VLPHEFHDFLEIPQDERVDHVRGAETAFVGCVDVYLALNALSELPKSASSLLYLLWVNDIEDVVKLCRRAHLPLEVGNDDAAPSAAALAFGWGIWCLKIGTSCAMFGLHIRRSNNDVAAMPRSKRQALVRLALAAF